jgi:hypothetical protein
MLRHHAVAGLHIAADQAEAGMAVSIHPNHRSCNAMPYVLPFFTGPRPQRRSAVVGNFTSVVSWIASTCRPAAFRQIALLRNHNHDLGAVFGVQLDLEAIAA